MEVNFYSVFAVKVLCFFWTFTVFYCEVSVLFYSLTGFKKGIPVGICTESLSVLIMLWDRYSKNVLEDDFISYPIIFYCWLVYSVLNLFICLSTLYPHSYVSYIYIY